jgi:hypothetical protein
MFSTAHHIDSKPYIVQCPSLHQDNSYALCKKCIDIFLKTSGCNSVHFRKTIFSSSTDYLKMIERKALWLESINEVWDGELYQRCYSEEENHENYEKEVNSLLQHMNFLIQYFSLKNLPIFVNISVDEIDMLLARKTIHEFIFKFPALFKYLMYIKSSPAYSCELFLESCLAKNIDDLFLGGIFGDSCVWQVASQIRCNIYSKILGRIPPNFRQFSIYSKTFTNVYICEGATEGYLTADLKSDFYIQFSSTPHYLNLPYEYYNNFEDLVDDMKEDALYENFNSAPHNVHLLIDYPLK